MAKAPEIKFADQYLPDSEHRRLHVLLSILALVIIGTSVYTYYQKQKIKQVVVSSPPMSTKSIDPELQRRLNLPNPKIELSDAEVQIKESLLKKNEESNKPVKLTPEEIKKKQALLTSN